VEVEVRQTYETPFMVVPGVRPIRLKEGS